MLQRCTSVLLATGAVKPLDAAAHKKIEAQIEGMAGQALRCLALAYKVSSHPNAAHGAAGGVHCTACVLKKHCVCMDKALRVYKKSTACVWIKHCVCMDKALRVYKKSTACV